MKHCKIALGATFLGALLFLPLAADAKGVEIVSQTRETGRVITGFQFPGSTVFGVDELRQVLSSKVGAPMDVENIASDVAALRKMYNDKGMAVEVASATQDDKGIVSFALIEAKILQVKLSGLLKVSDSVVRPLIKSQPGDVFDAAKVRADLQRCGDANIFESVKLNAEESSENKGGIILTFVFKERDEGQ